jgi:hypothetical protein
LPGKDGTKLRGKRGLLGINLEHRCPGFLTPPSSYPHRSGICKSLLDLLYPIKPGGLIPTTQLASTAHSPLPCSFLRVSYPGKYSKTCRQNLLLSRACEIPRDATASRSPPVTQECVRSRAQSLELPNLEKGLAPSGWAWADRVPRRSWRCGLGTWRTQGALLYLVALLHLPPFFRFVVLVI